MIAATRIPRTAFLTDTVVITRRNLLRILRTPQLLVFSTIQPVMFVLLFRYVFGGAIAVSTNNYADYLLPGIFVQTVVFGGTNTAVALAEDLRSGMIDRFRSLPMARSSVLAGRTTADLCRNCFVVALMIGVGMLVGFRFHGTPLQIAGAILLTLGFGFAWSWFFALIGLLVRDPETAQVAGFLPLFPLVFASSVFVPTSSMPTWLQGFAVHQPVSVVVFAVRGLSLGTATTSDVVAAAAWILGLLIVFVPLAVSRFRKG